MNQDASDFMAPEYDRISTAYFGLREQTTEMFKAYLTLVGLPLTVLVAVLNVKEGQVPLSLAGLPDVVTALLLVVAVLGFLVTMTLTATRMSMIQYARTINKVRGYSGDQDARDAGHRLALQPYLVLLTEDTKPSFFESGHSIFWQLLAIGALDGALVGVGCHNLLPLLPMGSVALGVTACGIHIGTYCWVAWKGNHGWNSPSRQVAQSETAAHGALARG